MVAGFLLRFVNLGYSDYQGDEIKAFYNPGDFSSSEFLLNQRKGPNQFLVTAVLKNVTSDYQNRLLTRAPFALSGFLACVVFYLLSKDILGKKAGMIATIFFITNGFLIAFSRIVQYQSFVILFGLLAIYLYLMSRKKSDFKYIYFSFSSLALSFLFHYDAIFFAIPITIWGLQDLCKAIKTKDGAFAKHFAVACFMFVILAGLFYVPFALNISGKTQEYWAGRLTGSVSAKVSSSMYLFTVYQPIYVIHIYTAATMLFFGVFLKAVIKKEVRLKHNLFPIIVWTASAVVFMEILVAIPGTHIYTYLIPMMMLLGWGSANFWNTTKKIVGKKADYLAIAGLVILTSFLYAQAWWVFVDHSSEYPWQDKKFLVWTLPKPAPTFHLSLFGFPYYRYWQEIGDLVNNGTVNYYTTNERVSITRYHIKLGKSGESIGYYVYIYSPQTFTDHVTNYRASEWMKSNPPIKSFYSKNGIRNADIYLLPETYLLPTMPQIIPTEVEVDD